MQMYQQSPNGSLRWLPGSAGHRKKAGCRRPFSFLVAPSARLFFLLTRPFTQGRDDRNPNGKSVQDDAYSVTKVPSLLPALGNKVVERYLDVRTKADNRPLILLMSAPFFRLIFT